MLVREVMTQNVRLIEPDTSLREAAAVMGEIDSGFLPVSENDRLVGAITDRDIALRGVAEGKGPDARVRDVMSTEVKYCYDDVDIDDAARNMSAIQLRRLPVVTREKKLVGIISLADIARSGETRRAGATLEGVARPSPQHNQSALRAWESQSGPYSAA
ncbi:MAG: CBS domain-containing protein [Caulobacterales bacterium]